LNRRNHHSAAPEARTTTESAASRDVQAPLRIPYVIDNEAHRLADVLNDVLGHHRGAALDVATAYFTVSGFGLLRERLEGTGSFRLLLGAEPAMGEQVGMRPEAGVVPRLLRRDLDALPFTEAALRLVEDLIAFLRREDVAVRVPDRGFLHAKCWLVYAGGSSRPLAFERLRPIVAVVGSSNFTAPGLTSNRELNLAHKVLLDEDEADDRQAADAVAWLSEHQGEALDAAGRRRAKSEVGARAIIELEAWFQRHWDESRDFKDDLIALLDASKFGQVEYTPYQVYMKALYEYLKEDLEAGGAAPTRSAVELAEFQEDAVRKARRILGRYDGVMIADSVGLGKTWIGKKLLEDFAYHLRQRAVVVCPASLRQMWKRELADATIAAQVFTQEELGRPEFEPGAWGDADVVLIDESHNFRNRNSQRYANLERLLGGNRGRGRDGSRKKVILLSATPINNDLFDLYNQISLITQGDRGYFSAAGIGDLYRYFLNARRDSRTGAGVAAVFNLLEEIVIRRTRPFIRRAYPEATINGQPVHFPERRLRTVRYDLERTYDGIYEDVVSGIERLKLAPYSLEAYVRSGVEVNEFEVGREQALVGIFKNRYLKRFESSVEAFRISIRRALEFIRTFEAYLAEGKVLRSSDFHRALGYLQREDEEDDATPRSLAEDMDAREEVQRLLAEMATIDPARYDLARLRVALQHDVEVLSDVWERVRDIGPAQDAKLQRMKELLAGELHGRKVLIFTYYKDTARYLYRNLGHPEVPEAQAFRDSLGGVRIRRMDSGADAGERQRIVESFAPIANSHADLAGGEQEIDVLISTDVLSEGQNLQDCGHLLNYDLHWNPTRMVQRAGRIDRIGTAFDTLWIYNMFPDEGLERLLHLVERLAEKIADIDRAGLLDASVLGETVNPRNFNTLRRIGVEDAGIIDEEEQFSELASPEFLIQQLRELLGTRGREVLDDLPDGIHSGLVRQGARGVFFYFQANIPRVGLQHFWRYCDLRTSTITDNRYLIANLIACSPDTPRVVEPAMLRSVFDLQEKVIDDILRTFQERRALEVAPRVIDPVQQTVATRLRAYLSHPRVDRARVIEAVRLLSRPMLAVQVRELRAALVRAQAEAAPGVLLDAVGQIQQSFGSDAADDAPAERVPGPSLVREDLRLICFDFVSGG
jgi:superfamily II DNA or RNA helicase